MRPKSGTKQAKAFKTPFSQILIPFSKAHHDSTNHSAESTNHHALSALTPRSSFYFPRSTSPINIGRFQKVTPGSKLKFKERFANGLGLQAHESDVTSPGISISFISQEQSDVGSTLANDDHVILISQESESMSVANTQEIANDDSLETPRDTTRHPKSALRKSDISKIQPPVIRSTAKVRTHDSSVDELDAVSFVTEADENKAVDQRDNTTHTNVIKQRCGQKDRPTRLFYELTPMFITKKRRLYGTDMKKKFDSADTASEMSTGDHVREFLETQKDMTHKPTARRMSKLAYESAKQEVLKVIYKMHLEIEDLQGRRRALNAGCCYMRPGQT